VLDISHNSITSFPSLPLATLPAIETLDLSDNQIGPWPSCQFNMPKLKRLNMLHNPLQEIPWTLQPGAPCLAGGSGGMQFDLARIMQPDPAIAIRGCALVME
jgi:Leucine-rich repeat (LRR) protein